MSRCIAPRTPPHSHHLGQRLLMGMEDSIDDDIIDLMGRTELEDDDDDD